MSRDVNTTTISGNLTRDPELRFTATGTAVCSFALAVNHRKKQGNDWVDEPSFIDVVCWQQLAENVAETLTKGDRAVVTGRLSQRSWEDRETHAKRSKVEVVADSVAAALDWATASINRNARSDGGARRSDGDPGPSAQEQYDEEPF